MHEADEEWPVVVDSREGNGKQRTPSHSVQLHTTLRCPAPQTNVVSPLIVPSSRPQTTDLGTK